VSCQDAQVNSLTSRLPDASTKMFLMHAVYGLGATVSPFVSTAFVQHEPTHVYYYFAVSLALAILTALVLALVFRGRTEDQVVGKRLPDEESSTEVQGGVPM
jgi:fucose permease